MRLRGADISTLFSSFGAAQASAAGRPAARRQLRTKLHPPPAPLPYLASLPFLVLVKATKVTAGNKVNSSMSSCGDDVGLLVSEMGKLLVGDDDSGTVEKTEECRKDGEDDGYSSEDRSEKSEEKSELDDEEILQPLSFVSCSPEPTIQYISRGPIDQESHYNRGHPYSRPGQCPPANISPVSMPGDAYQQPAQARVLVLKKADHRVPTPLEARVTWNNRHELCIEKHLLPADTYFGEDTVENKVRLYIQLDQKVNDYKCFLADVKTVLDTNGESKMRYIGPIVVSLKTELAESQERRLLDKTTPEERTAAYNLVHQKDLGQLTSGIGPHKDTVLSVLCAKRNPENPGQILAQIHAVVQRLKNHPDNTVKQTVFRLNNNQISAFEISAITNNSVVACYLAEVMYDISQDTQSALRVLNCKDTQGNTILHLLARKGDSNLNTMKDLLDMQLTDGTKIFTMIANSKKQFPMHIATQSVRNQPSTIRLLYQHMPRAFEVVDDDGMTALHYACQRTTDVELVREVLSHKKDNINAMTKDGLTALDLITRRCSSTTQTLGLFAIEQQQQAEMIGLIRNNGGRSTIHPEPRPREMTTATTCRPTLANADCSLAGSVSPSQSTSPEGSPYSYTQSNITSPRTPSLGSPCSVSNPSVNGMNSVGSFQQSSPESTPHGSPALVFQPSPNYSVRESTLLIIFIMLHTYETKFSLPVWSAW